MNTTARPFLPSLAQALAHDPFYRSISAGPATAAAREVLLQAYFDLACDEAQRVGRIDVTDQPSDGAAVWVVTADGAERQAAAHDRLAALHSVLGADNAGRYQQITANMDAPLASHDLASAWYLSIVGIAPERQGTGAGRRLLSAGIAAADAAGVASFLETFNPRSLGFYQSLGYQTTARFFEPVTQSDYWLMTRAPRQA